MQTLVVVGIRIDDQTNAPVLLLRDDESERFLPIWIGDWEAASIASALEGVEPDRPMTHDLFVAVLNATGNEDIAVCLTGVDEGTFYAEIDIAGTPFAARPSDAIALAIRLGAPIRCSQELVATAGVNLADEAKDEVEAFLKFIDNVSADDFKDPSS